MDILLRTVAVILEVVLLAAIAWAVLNGVRLAALDLGIKPRYNKLMLVAFFTFGLLMVVFFISHLISFYPEIGAGG